MACWYSVWILEMSVRRVWAAHQRFKPGGNPGKRLVDFEERLRRIEPLVALERMYDTQVNKSIFKIVHLNKF